MARSNVRRPIIFIAVGVLLAISLAGCGKSAPFRNMLAPGDDTRVEIDAPGGIDTWSVATSSPVDVVVVRLVGSSADVGAVRVRVFVPDDVVVALLAPPRGAQYSIALGGRQATWTLEFKLADGEQPPVRYRLVVERPSALGSGGTRCADVLRARGVNAWVSAISGPPGAGGIVFPGLGSIAVSATPTNAVSVGSPVGGGVSVLKLRAGTTIRGDFAGLGCDPGQMQLNFWDTGRGKPPVLTVSDPGGRPLCGSAGQPACLSNPPAQRWVSWTFSTPGTIRTLSLDSDELFLSSIVIQ